MDCMQIYKEIPIITAQPNKADMRSIPHLLYGFAESGDHFSFGKWVKLMLEALQNAQSNGLQPIIVGGTMMYAYMLLSGFSEIPEVPDDIRNDAIQMHAEIGHDEFLKIVQEIDSTTPQDSQRLVYNYCLLKVSGKGLNFYRSLPQKKLFKQGDIKVIVPQKTRKEVYATCNSRFLDMLEDGLLEEVSPFVHQVNLPIARATGFKYVSGYLRGNISKEEMIEKSQQETRNYAKKQIIWLRKFVLEGLITSVDAGKVVE